MNRNQLISHLHYSRKERRRNEIRRMYADSAYNAMKYGVSGTFTIAEIAERLAITEEEVEGMLQ